jgi:hypothetical protein
MQDLAVFTSSISGLASVAFPSAGDSIICSAIVGFAAPPPPTRPRCSPGNTEILPSDLTLPQSAAKALLGGTNALHIPSLLHMLLRTCYDCTMRNSRSGPLYATPIQLDEASNDSHPLLDCHMSGRISRTLQFYPAGDTPGYIPSRRV